MRSLPCGVPCFSASLCLATPLFPLGLSRVADADVAEPARSRGPASREWREAALDGEASFRQFEAAALDDEDARAARFRQLRIANVADANAADANVADANVVDADVAEPVQPRYRFRFPSFGANVVGGNVVDADVAEPARPRYRFRFPQWRVAELDDEEAARFRMLERATAAVIPGGRPEFLAEVTNRVRIEPGRVHGFFDRRHFDLLTGLAEHAVNQAGLLGELPAVGRLSVPDQFALARRAFQIIMGPSRADSAYGSCPSIQDLDLEGADQEGFEDEGFDDAIDPADRHYPADRH
ncbi:hypothetical protein GNI_160730 [Gregarina niphandrodes]|uniref:Secreted protein n=1 Tax=Gregarina niphandrodes TaxID=110365 RepID=A0A023AYK5_GRENI|nr:hypothetical protein GNI_160730 [Gregarina niphandrodes]EZG43746.1 hypothetical protein GNI_160730 [Gregarina niphandrodes]|eukprot:XP_011133033.1 hypothetical protein GNI_160730 [Gregarina niphandrodes]